MLTLRELLPPRYYKSAEMARLWETADAIFAPLWQAVFDVERQLDVSTATWGLALYERDYGLMPNVSETDNERRARIKSRMRGAGTSTTEMLQNLAAAYVDGQTSINDLQELFRLQVQFTGPLGIPTNLDDLTNALRDARPAHMEIEYLLRYLLIREVAKMTVGGLGEQTIDRFAFRRRELKP